LAENISIQRSNCNILGLTVTVAYQLTKSDFSDLGYFSGHVLSKAKSVTPQFLLPFGNSLALPFCVASLKKSVRGNFWARTSLNDIETKYFVISLKQDCKDKYT